MQCAIGKETDSLLPAQEGRKVCRRSDKEFFFVRKGADPDVCCYYCCFAGGFKSYSGAEDQVLKKQPKAFRISGNLQRQGFCLSDTSTAEQIRFLHLTRKTSTPLSRDESEERNGATEADPGKMSNATDEDAAG